MIRNGEDQGADVDSGQKEGAEDADDLFEFFHGRLLSQATGGFKEDT